MFDEIERRWSNRQKDLSLNLRAFLYASAKVAAIASLLRRISVDFTRCASHLAIKRSAAGSGSELFLEFFLKTRLQIAHKHAKRRLIRARFHKDKSVLVNGLRELVLAGFGHAFFISYLVLKVLTGPIVKHLRAGTAPKGSYLWAKTPLPQPNSSPRRHGLCCRRTLQEIRLQTTRMHPIQSQEKQLLKDQLSFLRKAKASKQRRERRPSWYCELYFQQHWQAQWCEMECLKKTVTSCSDPVMRNWRQRPTENHDQPVQCEPPGGSARSTAVRSLWPIRWCLECTPWMRP